MTDTRPPFNLPVYEIRLRSKGIEVSFDTGDPAFAAEQIKQWTKHLFGVTLAAKPTTFVEPTLSVPNSGPLEGLQTIAEPSVSQSHLQEQDIEPHPCLPEEFQHLVQNAAIPVQNPVELPVQNTDKPLISNSAIENEVSEPPPVENSVLSHAPLVAVSEGDRTEQVKPDETQAEKAEEAGKSQEEDAFEDLLASLISEVDVEADVVEGDDSQNDNVLSGPPVDLPEQETLETLPESVNETESVQPVVETSVETGQDVPAPEPTLEAPVSESLELLEPTEEALSPSSDPNLERLSEASMSEEPAILQANQPVQATLDLSSVELVSSSLQVVEPETTFADSLPGLSSPTAVAVLERPLDGEKPVVDSLKALFELAPRAAMGEDYLLLSAYFLDQFRNQSSASMRDMNAELIRSGLTPINHAVIETAVSKGLLELLPDTTGNALVTEYRLTSDGFAALEGLLS